MGKLEIQERQQKIIDLVREFCAKKLDEENLELAGRLIQKLGRKKNNLFLTGQPQVWAAAIIHALGTINFLFDKSFEPYISVDEINQFFGTSKSTTGNKSKQIRELFNLDRFDQAFSTKKMEQENSFNNLVMVDGLTVPLDTLPEQYQEMVRQARIQGKDISFNTR